MDITATFLPVAVELIDNVFATPIVYTRSLGGAYNPSTGDYDHQTEVYDIDAGILSRGRAEEGGVAETYEIRFWIHHASSTGFPFLPKNGDFIEYDNTEWKVTDVDPTYSSAGLIASRITARNQ